MSSPLPITPEAVITELARKERGRLLASLIATLRDFQLAEDCLQEALISAMDHWSRSDIPSSPAGWILQVARRKAVDRIRRDQNFSRKSTELAHLIAMEQAHPEPVEDHEIPDERLRLMFTCCHPALDKQNQVALTLHTLGGLTTPQIARAFLVARETMAQRLVRAKAKIKKAGIAYRIPEQHEWSQRLDAVMSVIYLVFNEGYSASSGDTAIRRNLCDEAIRLGRILTDLTDSDPETLGLLALMLLHHARSQARQQVNRSHQEIASEANTEPKETLIALENQNRSLWDTQKIVEGCTLVERALSDGPPGPYQIQAAISAIHCEAKSHDETDWQQIALLYQLLHQLGPDGYTDPIIELNRAVAISYWQSPENALTVLQPLAGTLATYRPFHAAMADCLKRSGDIEQALLHYDHAIGLGGHESETRFLETRRHEVLKSATSKD